jgi:hypothetical protein
VTVLGLEWRPGWWLNESVPRARRQVEPVEQAGVKLMSQPEGVVESALEEQMLRERQRMRRPPRLLAELGDAPQLGPQH